MFTLNVTKDQQLVIQNVLFFIAAYVVERKSTIWNCANSTSVSMTKLSVGV